jgi:succinate dehydrogenase / fumarate reductase flavoprotein subunit
VAAQGRPRIDQEQVAAVRREALAPFERADAPGAENPYRLQIDLQNVMHDLVGIIRTADELERALKELGELRERAGRVAVEGHRQFNPGWHLAMDLQSLLMVSECIATAALARRESRGGHTRDDYPKPDPEFAGVNHVLRLRDGKLQLSTEALPQLPDELQEMITSAATPPAASAQPGAAQPGAAPART